jgi:hypothetical protein
MASSPAVRSVTAVFTAEVPDDEEWEDMIAYIQDHFDTQWIQTRGSGAAWTVTIHGDDILEEEIVR